MVENLELMGRNLESMDNPMELSAISKSLSNVSVNITINIATIGNPPVERVLSDIVMMISSYAETARRRVVELEPLQDVGDPKNAADEAANGLAGDAAGGPVDGLDGKIATRLLSVLTQGNLGIVVLEDFGTIALIVNGGEAPFLQRGEPLPDMITEALSDDTAEANWSSTILDYLCRSRQPRHRDCFIVHADGIGRSRRDGLLRHPQFVTGRQVVR